MEAHISVRTQKQADKVQALFQMHKEDNVVDKIEAFIEDNDEVGIIFTFRGDDEFHYRLDINGEIITAGFFGGGADSWFNS